MSTLGLAPQSPKREFSWKPLFIKAAGFGAGFALLLSSITIGLLWYASRPRPRKPWDSTVLVAKEAPSFKKNLAGGNKSLDLTYVVANTSVNDYEIHANTDVRIAVRDKQGVFFGSGPTTDDASLELPVFIPAKKEAYVTLSLKLATMPDQNPGESDEAYHERVRTYLETLDWVGSFVLFDEARRYEIDLPKWLTKPPLRGSPK